MRKLVLVVIVAMVPLWIGRAVADPAKTAEAFLQAAFKQGDLKHAFSYLCKADQQFIQAESPELYALAMSNFSEESPGVNALASKVQTFVISTIGKMTRLEVGAATHVSDSYEVAYKLTYPLDLDFYLKLIDWGKAKVKEIEAAEDLSLTIQKIEEVLAELPAKLENASYKSSVTLNLFLKVVEEEGQEKVALDLAQLSERLEQLDQE